MIKTILVPATGSESDLTVFSCALIAARAFGAHIDALHVRFDPVEVAVKLTSDAIGTSLAGDLIQKLEEDVQAREARAKRLFENFCSSEGLPLQEVPATARTNPSAAWHVETGDEALFVSRFGMTVDLIVAGRGDDNNTTARALLEAALLDTGRPLLIPSKSPILNVSGQRVAIAWKPTVQAARAITAAMPFLEIAAGITVLTVDEEESHVGGESLIRSLQWHGFHASAERISTNGRDPVDTLVGAAKDRADLLVMGGYGHSRFREWVFGGFTQRMLADAPLPVLMSH